MSSIEHWLANPATRQLLTSLLAVAVIIGLVGVFRKYLSGFIEAPINRYRARKMVALIGYATALIVLATIFSDHLGGLSVALGVAGAGIAFALQEVIASVAGWLALSVGSFYKTGDRIQLGGIMGDVIDIGVLRTTLMECRQWVNGDQYNGRIVRIANSFVFKEPVFNYSGDFHFLWDEVAVPVKYGSDYKLARQLFLRIADEVTGEYARSARSSWQTMVDKYLIEDATVEPMVFLTANDNWMEFAVRYVVDYKKRRVTKDLLFTRILEEIEQTEGRVAIASTTIHIVETPQIRVSVSGESEGSTTTGDEKRPIR